MQRALGPLLLKSAPSTMFGTLTIKVDSSLTKQVAVHATRMWMPTPIARDVLFIRYDVKMRWIRAACDFATVIECVVIWNQTPLNHDRNPMCRHTLRGR